MEIIRAFFLTDWTMNSEKGNTGNKTLFKLSFWNNFTKEKLKCLVGLAFFLLIPSCLTYLEDSHQLKWGKIVRDVAHCHVLIQITTVVFFVYSLQVLCFFSLKIWNFRKRKLELPKMALKCAPGMYSAKTAGLGRDYVFI